MQTGKFSQRCLCACANFLKKVCAHALNFPNNFCAYSLIFPKMSGPDLGLLREGPGRLEDEGVEDEEGAEGDPVVADDQARVEHRVLQRSKNFKQQLTAVFKRISLTTAKWLMHSSMYVPQPAAITLHSLPCLILILYIF